MNGFEHADGQGFPLENFQFFARDEIPRGRPDLDDVGIARIKIDGGEVKAGERLFGGEGDQAVYRGEHRFRGHFRLVKTFQKGKRAGGNVAGAFSAAHAVGEGDEKAALVYAKDGMRIAALHFSLFGSRGNAERGVEAGFAAVYEACAGARQRDLFGKREGDAQRFACNAANRLCVGMILQRHAHGVVRLLAVGEDLRT